METRTPNHRFISCDRHRGGIALSGPAIDAIAGRWAQRFSSEEGFQRARAARLRRDGEEHHLTVSTPWECKQFEICITAFRTAIEESDLFDLGVGSRSGCYYVVVIAPKLQKLRKQLGLVPVDLHITLGFEGSDAHDIRKDVQSLLPCPKAASDMCCTAERVLRAPSSRAGREHFHYHRIAHMAAREGYLFGVYYLAKFGAFSARASHDLLEQAILCPSTSRRLDEEPADYGDLVCQALNYNVYDKTSYNKLRRFYSSKAETVESLCCYDFEMSDLPRNFSFVTETLAGSSILEYRRYFELFVRLGITDVITLMDDPLRPALYSGLPIRYHFFAVVDRTPPTAAQMRDIVAIHAAGGRTLIHCQGGVGRTATALAAILMWTKGQSRSEATQPLLEHRKTILDQSQEDFLSAWYEECQKQRTHPLPYVPCVLKVKLPPIIMCIGYPASGKSTFADTLSTAFRDRISRVNQDESGRHRCEEIMGMLPKVQGRTVVLDRCNLTKAERKEWLALGHNKRAWAVVFTAPLEECKWRIVRRTGHPTVKHGAGARIVDSVSDKLEVPDKGEGFEQLFYVPTFDACNMLLQSWGCDTIPQTTMPEEEGMLKFPRTRHVVNMGAASRDDLVMDDREVLVVFLNHEVFVEEKIDGANMGISIRNNKLCAQNRSHFVTSAYHSQFKLLDKWLSKHADDLWRILDSDRYILYGEWVYAKHSIHYQQLPDWFVAFDMYDKLERKFWSRPRLQEHLEGTSIRLIPLVARRSFSTVEELRALARVPSQFYDGPVEGVYLRRTDGPWLSERGKIVRSDFICGNEFWSKGGIQANSRSLNDFQY